MDIDLCKAPGPVVLIKITFYLHTWSYLGAQGLENELITWSAQEASLVVCWVLVQSTVIGDITNL